MKVNIGAAVSCDYVRFGKHNYNPGCVPADVVYTVDKPMFLHASSIVKRVDGKDVLLKSGQRIPLSCARVAHKCN